MIGYTYLKDILLFHLISYFFAGIEGCIAKGIYVKVRFYVFGRMVGQETEGRGRKVVEMGGKSGIVR